MSSALIADARKLFHADLISSEVLTVSPAGIASNADKDNTPSRAIAKSLADILGAPVRESKLSGQTLGKLFETQVCAFLSATFPRLQHLRPGKWDVLDLGNRGSVKTSSFAQYEHLAYLAEVVGNDPKLETALGNGYMIAPDIVVARNLCEDDEINASGTVVDQSVCNRADLRKRNGGAPLLHASISAKWTMRSDRAQNSRTEALNLIRNRKGHLPHIVAVTAEPLPSRLASLALGTGDLDCVYHIALDELLAAVRAYSADGREDIIEQLETMVQGKRLKDISDLPLDLSC